MSNEIEKFDFQGAEFRVVQRDGEPWFFASDVAGILGLGRARDALKHLDDDEKGATTSRTPGGDQQVSTINEPGLYSLMLRSRKPVARDLKRWVTHEVLPTIRKTGGMYVAPGSRAEIDLTNPDTALGALEKALDIARGYQEENARLTPRAVAAVGAESKMEGQSLWDLRYAIADTLGTNINDSLKVSAWAGAIAKRGKHYVVSVPWSDVLFNTETEIVPDKKSGKVYYQPGPVRVRPGKQSEFLSRLESKFVGKLAG